MKFFWKIFFTVMFISVACFSVGGYLLIHSDFQALLDREVQTARDYGDIVYYSLSNELKDVGFAFRDSEVNGVDLEELLGKIAQSMNIDNMNQRISFGILNNSGKVLFSSLEENLDKNMRNSLTGNQSVWALKETENGIYVQMIQSAPFFGNTYYIETIRNASFIFENQKSQYETMLKIMVGMLVLAGTITLVVSKLLMRQVAALTRVTKTISAGDLGMRVDIRGDDEFAALSRNFNQMADNLEEKIHELKEESERKELFVGAFSHELKTPLTSIIGYADLLRRKEMSGEQRHTCAEYIFIEGKRLETMSMRLLELIVLKNQELHLADWDMRQLFHEAYVVAGPQLIKFGVTLSCRMEPAVAAVEPELLKTVFINLLDNGRKAMEEGGQITVTGSWQGEIYSIVIQDSGKGMEKEELERIKEAFYMVDKSRARKQGGAGLGLALCDEILKLHGFSMDFDSRVNEGTTVTITIRGAKR